MNDVERFELAPGYSIARLINGCWQLTPDHGGGPNSEKETQRIFAELVEHGFTTFDCADIYIGVEEALGRFRAGRSERDNIQIHTKYAANRDTLSELSNKDIDDAVDRSLKRLRVEQLDLLQYHWWNYAVPGLENLTERLVRAQQAGKIRLLGVTNFNTEHVREIVAAGASIVSLQSQYSLLDRRPEKEMSQLANEAGVALLSYGVLAGGFLCEKYLGADAPAAMNRSLQKYRLIIDDIGGWGNFQALLRVLSDVARKHDATIAAVAIRWVLDQPGVGAVMLGIGKKSRAQENLGVGRLTLDASDQQAIDAVLKEQRIPAGDMYDLERDIEGRHASIIRMNLHDEEDQR